jgi:cobaltochelatase CobN
VIRQPRHRTVAFGGIALLLAALAFTGWSRYVAPTRVALVNYPGFQAARILKSQPPWVHAEVLPIEQLERIGRFDVAILFGRALRLDEAREAPVRRAGAAGTRLWVKNPGSPEMEIKTKRGDTITQYKPQAASDATGPRGRRVGAA